MSPTLRGWTPIVAGPSAAAAREAVLAIGDALRDRPEDPESDPTLAAGAAGIAIALHELDLAYPGRGWGQRARADIRSAVTRAHAGGLGPRFFLGVAGVAFAVLHLHAALALDEELELCRALDDALRSRLARRHEGRWDLGAGLVGWGVYAALPRPWLDDGELTRRIVHALGDGPCTAGPEGRFFVAPHLLAPAVRKTFPHGHVDLGLAHGAAGVIAWLEQLGPRGERRATQIASQARRWLRTQEAAWDRRYSSFAAPHDGPRRDAWCYGDPGVAVAFASAGCRSDARAVAERAAARCTADTTAEDPSFCHGAAGLAHLFHRLGRATSSPKLLRAARLFVDRTLACRREDCGVAGFARLDMSPSGPTWVDDPGLLAGAAGIALCLHAAIGHERPRWDRAVLLSLEEDDRDHA